MQEMQEIWIQSWVGKMPWRRKWQSTPAFLPGKFHGQRSLAGFMELKRVGHDRATGHTYHTHIDINRDRMEICQYNLLCKLMFYSLIYSCYYSVSSSTLPRYIVEIYLEIMGTLLVPMICLHPHVGPEDLNMPHDQIVKENKQLIKQVNDFWPFLYIFHHPDQLGTLASWFS